MPIQLPGPLSGVDTNIQAPPAPGDEITIHNIYDTVQYRKAVEFAQGQVCFLRLDDQ
jgi:hypothetical protein